MRPKNVNKDSATTKSVRESLPISFGVNTVKTAWSGCIIVERNDNEPLQNKAMADVSAKYDVKIPKVTYQRRISL